MNSDFLISVLRSAVNSASVLRTDCNPVSCLLSAPVERGKTSIALKAASNRVFVCSDLSAMGIAKAIKDNPKISHILINDLTVVTGHKHEVSTLLISTLNALAEEGVFNLALPTSQSLDGRKVGVFACLTEEMLSDKRTWWIKSGFASRMLILRFDHSQELVAAIHKIIETDTGSSKGAAKTGKPSAAPVGRYVHISPKAATEIKKISEDVARTLGEVGYRKHKQMRSLACGHALMCNHRIVAAPQLEFLAALRPYITERVLL